MGEIAEMHLDGTVCEMCGEFLDGESPGFPRYCSEDCAQDRGVDFEEEEDDVPNFESIKDDIDSAIIWLEMAMKDLQRMAIKKKVRSLANLIKNIEVFKESIK